MENTQELPSDPVELQGMTVSIAPEPPQYHSLHSYYSKTHYLQ